MKSFLDEMFRKGPRIVRPEQEEEQGEKRPKREKKIMKHWKRAAIGIAIAAVAVLIGTQSVYTINEQEQAVVTTFGRAEAVRESGLHFKIPFVQ